MSNSLSGHAKEMRKVRSGLPKVSSAEAHQQARRVLEKAREPERKSNAKSGNSSSGRKPAAG